MGDAFSVPDEVELLDFFGTEAVERSVEDGYWCYEASDGGGVTLRFSFHLFDRSVQTAIRVKGIEIATVSHEGAREMAVDGTLLRCRFSYQGAEGKLVLSVTDSIKIEWWSLRADK